MGRIFDEIGSTWEERLVQLQHFTSYGLPLIAICMAWELAVKHNRMRPWCFHW